MKQNFYDYIPAGYRVNDKRKLELISNPNIIWPETEESYNKKENKDINIEEIEEKFSEPISDENKTNDDIVEEVKEETHNFIANKVKRVIK